MAMIAGNVIITFVEPKRLAAMPKLTVKFFVLRLDKNGHIIWPTNFSAKTQAALRKQARERCFSRCWTTRSTRLTRTSKRR